MAGLFFSILLLADAAFSHGFRSPPVTRFRGSHARGPVIPGLGTDRRLIRQS
jgi:hypothetical protein